MPTVSEKQRRAMQAAAHGRSTLGIPKKVGEEFVAADAKGGIAAGIVYVAPDGEILLLLRSAKEENFANHWALPGGKAEAGESAEDAADREAAEELGNTAPSGPKKLLDKRSTPNGMVFHTFAQPVDVKFWPRLNDEHTGAGWFSLDQLPRPMHPAVRATLGQQLGLGMAEDMTPEDWTALRENFAKWTREEEQEDEHAEDGRAFDMAGFMRGLGTLASDGWNEGDHPRADNGQFGSGGASSKPALKMGALSKKGGKLGSNEGGVYEGEGGSKFYIKKPATKAHVENERTAARLYNLAGAKTLDYRDVEGGEHVATEWQKLEKKNISEFTPAERKEAAKDFAIHAWLSNWDAAGTGGDNQGVLNGKTTTLDVGGSLRFRAQGGPKGAAFGDKVSEWDTMRNKGMSPDAAKLFAPMTEDELRASVERVTAIPDDKIRTAVGGDKELADRLIARKKDLAQRVGLAMDSKAEPEHTLLVRYDGDFNFGGLISHLRRLGSIGASRTIEAQDEDDKKVPFGWDGDGADKIWAAELDGEALAFDRAMVIGIVREGLAFDRAPDSVRDFDANGNMHVEVSNISKATVNPYLGKEIPKYKELGLEPDRIYKLLRHPDELKKGAATFNNLPLLDEHVGVSSADHKPQHIIGSTGTDAEFDGKYLKNSLVFWADRGIKAVETKRKKELSSAYRFRADMTPGTFQGERYDGVMRDIIGNHVALVEEGRAGSDVVVGDSSNPLITTQEKFDMAKNHMLSRRGTVAYGALMTFLQPQLAMDAKIDIAKPLRGVTGANFKKKRPAIAAAIEKAVEGKLAQDGSIKAGLDAVLDMIEGMPKAEDEFPDEKKPAEDEEPEAGAEDEDDEDADTTTAKDEDETEEQKAAREKAAKDKKAKDAKAAKDKKARDEATAAENEEKDKKAMDAQIKLATDQAIKTERERLEAISAAKDHVRPRVGNLAMAFDSAGDVYRKALTIAGKDVAKLKNADVETLAFVFDSLPSAHTEQRSTFAMDSAPATTDLAKRQPDLAKNLARIGSA